MFSPEMVADCDLGRGSRYEAVVMAWSVTAGTVPKNLGQKNVQVVRPVRSSTPVARAGGADRVAGWTTDKTFRPG
jgi:hypothetical protein